MKEDCVMSSLKIFFILSTFVSSLLFGATSYSQAIKEKKIYPMGKLIHTKRCATLDAKKYGSYDALFTDIKEKHICSKLSAKYSEALAIYLWDKRSHREELPKLTVTKKDKCPICGMYLHYYPTWVTRITYSDKKVYSFDGIKDMLKYYFKHQKGIKSIWIQDYYTLKTLDARKAFYVIGSDVYGPMGHELIGFATLKSAKNFSLDHKGKDILSFREITPKVVRSLDE